MLQFLLTEMDVDPSAHSNEFHDACANRHVDVVQLLLADARVKPSLDVIKFALKDADEGNNVAIVNMLFKSQPQLMMSMCRG